MNIKEFQKLTQKTKEKNPRIFDLDTDVIPTQKDIEQIQNYYKVLFPKSYKEFLLQYGGGYFAFLVVYSLDEESPFFIKNNVEIDYVQDRGFIPVIDFETGDVAGFRIVNGSCEEMISIYNHEEDIIIGTKMDFFDALATYAFNLE